MDSRPRNDRRQGDAQQGDWLANEPRCLAVMGAEIGRQTRRMQGRPGRVLVLAGTLTALIVLRLATRSHMYKAQVILAATQGSLNHERGAPLPLNELRDYVYEGILSKQVIVEQVIKEHGVELDTLQKFGEDAAIEAVRDRLAVDVAHNYFWYGPGYESAPRSLRLIISYQLPDPDMAHDTARLFADLVVDSVQKQRLYEARFAATSMRQTIVDIAADVADQQARQNQLAFELTAAEMAQDRDAVAAARVAIKDLGEELDSDEQTLDMLRKDMRQLELDLGVEEHNMGLVWDVAGEVRPRAAAPYGPLRLAAVGLSCLFTLVPISMMFLGAFDCTVHDAGDVRRLGMPVVGHIAGPVSGRDGVT